MGESIGSGGYLRANVERLDVDNVELYWVVLILAVAETVVAWDSVALGSFGFAISGYSGDGCGQGDQRAKLHLDLLRVDVGKERVKGADGASKKGIDSQVAA